MPQTREEYNAYQREWQRNRRAEGRPEDKAKAAAYARKWRAENRERHLEAKRAYAEKNREKINEQNRASNARNAENRRAYAKKWAKENSERERANTKRWRAANPEKVAVYDRAARGKRRAAETGSLHPAATSADIMTLETACQACAGPAEHLDHIWPLARGGCSALHNLQWLCAPCNQSKHAKTMEEWVR